VTTTTDPQAHMKLGCWSYALLILGLSLVFAVFAVAKTATNSEGGMSGATEIFAFAIALPYALPFAATGVLLHYPCRRRFPVVAAVLIAVVLFYLAWAGWNRWIDPQS
jgi:hypothetical protein